MVYYCCRNDTPAKSSYTGKLMFMEPYYLIPITNACHEFPNTTSTLQSVEYIVENTMDPIVSGNLHPFFIINGNSTYSVKSFYCYYEPGNSADEIVVTPPGPLEINAYFQFKFKIQLKSNHGFLTNGIDAGIEISAILYGLYCSNTTWRLNLVNGAAAITGMACAESNNSILSVRVNTTKGRQLESQTNIKFKSIYNSLLLVNKQFIDKNTNNTFVNRTKAVNNSLDIRTVYFESQIDIINEFKHKLKLDESAPDRIHHVMILEPTDSLNTILSVAAGYKIPTLIFDIRPAQEKDVREVKEVRYVSVPPTSNFVSILSSDVIKKSSGIVIYRIRGAVSFREFYSIFKNNVNLLNDIILDDSNDVKISQLEVLKQYPKCSVFLFLDSMRASYLLSAAISLGLTPDAGYNWFSFSPKYVITDTFIRDACQQSNPQCHVIFKNMWNIFHPETISDCPLSLSTLQLLSVPMVNLTQFVFDEMVDTSERDMIQVTSEFVRLSRDQNKTLDSDRLMRYIDSLDCLASGSGLQFVSLPIVTQDELNNNTLIILCQPGWSGKNCNIPVCSLSSCNTTYGECIAPETCHCQPGRYGRSCLGDCRQTCINGICNDGIFGDGTCKSCHWLYLGSYCKSKSIIYGFVAAGLGTSVVAIYIILYVVRLLQTQEQNTEAEIEINEIDYTMSWDDLESVEDIDYELKISRKHLTKKLRYTKYKKATTFSGKDVFIKCIAKPYCQLSLGLKTEIQVLVKLKHENIEKLLGIIFSQPTIGIVTEVANMGSLYDVLHEKHIPITWDVKYSMMQDICRGMSYLHDTVNMEHGGLKSTNCLLHQGKFSWIVSNTISQGISFSFFFFFPSHSLTL